jgi:hypothetical protein
VKFYRIASWQFGAQVAGLDRVMQPVCIASQLFLSKGWLATCWAGVLLHFPGIIARETLSLLSGVPERTQFAYEKQSGVVNHPNYASFGRVVDDPQRAIRLYGIPGFFTRDGVILRRLPNHRSFMQVAGLEMASRGRTKHINRALVLKVASRPQEDALTAQNPISANPSMVPLRRLYCQHPSQLKRALRAWRNWQGDARQRPLFIYYHDPDTRPKHVYQAICL